MTISDPTPKLRLSKVEWILHATFLVFLLSMLNVNWSDNWMDASRRESPVSPFSIFLIPIFFYLNLLWLMPTFFKRETWYLYLIISFCCVMLPEMVRLSYVISNNELTVTFANIERLFWVRDNVIFGAFNPVWLGMVPSAGYFLIKSYVLNTKRVAALENQKLVLELSLIKSQINPHFFFNSLNTLDGLIDQDTEKAKQYIHVLGKVYRYILSKGNEDVVSALEEWSFCADFIALINIRFGDAYQFEIQGNMNQLEGNWLPPASLQGLLENAVKHNVGTIKKPLRVEILILNNSLCVMNKIVPKQGQQMSTGKGLVNLLSRYRLLFNHEVKIEKTDSFRVELPLIQNQP